MFALSRKITIMVLLLGFLSASALPTFAQGIRTITLTEQQINENYRMTNPRSASLSNMTVDLQPTQVVVSGTYTPPRADGFHFSVILVASIQNERLVWEVAQVSTDTGEVSDAVIESLNRIIMNSWRNYFKENHNGRITAFEITHDAIIITTDGSGVNTLPPITPGDGEIVITESQINAAYRVTNPRRASLSNLFVDLQPNTVVISATVNPRRVDPYNVILIYEPYVENGRLFWTLHEVLIDGTEPDDISLDQITTAVSNSWLSYSRNQYTGRIDSVIVTESEFILTVVGRSN